MTLDQPINSRTAFKESFKSGKPVTAHTLAGAPARGGVTEAIAHFLGTPAFIGWLTVFCVAWLVWNTWAPEMLQFDSRHLGFTALTLILSLQASYAAPLILLSQNRQTERDRVAAEQDRERDQRNLADTEFIAREIAAIRLRLEELATREYVDELIRSTASSSPVSVRKTRAHKRHSPPPSSPAHAGAHKPHPPRHPAGPQGIAGSTKPKPVRSKP